MADVRSGENPKKGVASEEFDLGDGKEHESHIPEQSAAAPKIKRGSQDDIDIARSTRSSKAPLQSGRGLNALAEVSSDAAGAFVDPVKPASAPSLDTPAKEKTTAAARREASQEAGVMPENVTINVDESDRSVHHHHHHAAPAYAPPQQPQYAQGYTPPPPMPEGHVDETKNSVLATIGAIALFFLMVGTLGFAALPIAMIAGVGMKAVMDDSDKYPARQGFNQGFAMGPNNYGPPPGYGQQQGYDGQGQQQGYGQGQQQGYGAQGRDGQGQQQGQGYGAQGQQQGRQQRVGGRGAAGQGYIPVSDADNFGIPSASRSTRTVDQSRIVGSGSSAGDGDRHIAEKLQESVKMDESPVARIKQQGAARDACKEYGVIRGWVDKGTDVQISDLPDGDKKVTVSHGMKKFTGAEVTIDQLEGLAELAGARKDNLQKEANDLRAAGNLGPDGKELQDKVRKSADKPVDKTMDDLVSYMQEVTKKDSGAAHDKVLIQKRHDAYGEPALCSAAQRFAAGNERMGKDTTQELGGAKVWAEKLVDADDWAQQLDKDAPSPRVAQALQKDKYRAKCKEFGVAGDRDFGTSISVVGSEHGDGGVIVTVKNSGTRDNEVVTGQELKALEVLRGQKDASLRKRENDLKGVSGKDADDHRKEIDKFKTKGKKDRTYSDLMAYMDPKTSDKDRAKLNEMYGEKGTSTDGRRVSALEQAKEIFDIRRNGGSAREENKGQDLDAARSVADIISGKDNGKKPSGLAAVAESSGSMEAEAGNMSVDADQGRQASRNARSAGNVAEQQQQRE